MREHAATAAVRSESGDGRISLALGGFLQARASASDAEAGQADRLLTLARTRLYAFGHAYDPSLRYRMMFGTNGDETTFQLFDAYVEKTFAPELRLRVGRGKVPVFRAWVESARMLSAVERDAATVALLPGREVMAMVRGELGGDTLEYAVTAFDPGGGSHGTALPAGAARIVWNAQGRAIEGEVDFDDAPLTIALGASAMAGRKKSLTVEGRALEADETLAGSEVLLRAHGFDLGAEAELRERRSSDGMRWRVRAGYVRADYFVAPLASALGVRASTIQSTDPTLRERDEVEFDAGYYPFRHDVKVNAEVALARAGVERAREVRGAVQLQVAF